MSTPTSLPAALLRHAAETPEDPWLFRPEGLDWRWHPFGEMARRMELDAGVAASAEVPFRAEPAWVSLDLARQAAGRGVVLRTADGSAMTWRAAELVAEGEAFGAELERAAGLPAAGREIVVWSGPPDDPERRALLAWATLRGAALVLEPDPGALAATAAWARPTVFQGTAGDLAALRQSVEEGSARRWFRRAPALPLRRLRAIQVVGPRGLSAPDEAFWRSRGVALIAAERRSRGI